MQKEASDFNLLRITVGLLSIPTFLKYFKGIAVEQCPKSD